MIGPTNNESLRERIAKVMTDYGVDFYEGNLMHRTEQRLRLIEDFQTDLIDLIEAEYQKRVADARINELTHLDSSGIVDDCDEWRDYYTSAIKTITAHRQDSKKGGEDE